MGEGFFDDELPSVSAIVAEGGAVLEPFGDQVREAVELPEAFFHDAKYAFRAGGMSIL